jgi:dienelactone hydrolase
MQTQQIDYFDDDVLLKAYIAFDDKITGKRPAILIAHDWTGQNELARQKAEKIAALGYLGFALDMYGNGEIGANNEEKSTLMKPLIDDRALLRKRIQAAFNAVQRLPQVNAAYIGAIGFCFGGLCVLDLARSGVDIKGVVSFHGLLNGSVNGSNEKIKAKILALQGHDDPMVSPEQVLAFENEMTTAGADWQLHVYGNTMHAFTNPLANDPGFGTVYNQVADSRAWVAMQNFFAEVFI